ncbi:hypothetical protein PFLmoz3_04129 [Pseudomonas fluorescens]|uniref:Uncharacterized protein n=1 Tax=Pseudomonas fluorescens TaxID=294 RepID=A0A125QI03_PSEFL|nr:hypothetical protein PFLmoz3_04129 [Pseudomonas fluorescens]
MIFSRLALIEASNGSLRLSASTSRKCSACSLIELLTSAGVLVLLPSPTNIADSTSARRASCIMSASMWLRSTVMLTSLSCTASAIRVLPR